MFAPRALKVASLLAACALLLYPAALAQDSRPRRVAPPPARDDAAARPAPAAEPTPIPGSQPGIDADTAGDPPAYTPPSPDTDAPPSRLESEPTVRIGLTTSARAVNISTAGQLLLASDELGASLATPTPVAAARVRIEPHLFGPAASSPGADVADEAAFGDNTIDALGASTQNGVRLTSRSAAPARGLTVYAAGAAQLMHARAPVTFASADEEAAPLHFNERPYRGRIEVFTNPNGSLTVVNVVQLEQYVRGVVPNELSPGGYPAVEALKAQAVAARTYAVSNRGRYASSGFDLLPTIRSQVYGGKSTEHPLTDRAVAETRGVVATHAGRPINALYTSTCGGHTEDADKIFGGEQLTYLRARSCSIHAHARTAAQSLAAPTLVTTREPIEIGDAERQRGPRDAALLLVHGLRSTAPVTDDWLSDDLEAADALALLELATRLARRPPPAAVVTAATLRPPGFATALAHALDGESRAAVLLDAATVDYLLAFRDAEEVPAASRADVALLLRDGHLTLHPDATLRPRRQLTRARALRAVAGLLEARGLVRLQKATARPSPAGRLAIRGAKGPERTLDVAPATYLFRAFGETLYAVRSLSLVGGEPITFHTGAGGAIDYLEVRPAPNGAAAERTSPFTNWSETLTAAEVARRLARHSRQAGELLDLRVAARGASGRALDLELVGATGTAHVRGGRIRPALGLREQLFVIDRRHDESGRVAAYVFTGRGWGHGVGLCQVGAYGLARAGLTYDKILKHYYTGIELTKAY